MAFQNFVLFVIILTRNIAPLLACSVDVATTTTSTTSTTTTTTGACTATIDICPSSLTGFSASCTNSVCTFGEGESFTIAQDACMLRGINRPLFIDGMDLPLTEVAPTADTVVTCNGGVVSSAGGAVDPTISTIACSEDCVVNLNLNGADGTTATFGNCAAGVTVSDGTQCLINNDGNIVQVGFGMAAGDFCVALDNLVITTADGGSVVVPAIDLVVPNIINLTCNTDGTVTASGFVNAAMVTGLTCVEP